MSAAPRLPCRGTTRHCRAFCLRGAREPKPSRCHAFIDKITDYCEHLATLSTMIGRPRPELRPQYRSITFGNYVIFLRYGDDAGPRSHLYIIHILHGARDLDAYFRGAPDDEEET